MRCIREGTMMSFNQWMSKEDQSDEEMDRIAGEVTNRFIRNNPEIVDEFLTKMVRSMTSEYEEDKE